MHSAMQETIYHNGGVGTITGYYDAELSILSVSICCCII